MLNMFTHCLRKSVSILAFAGASVWTYSAGALADTSGMSSNVPMFARDAVDIGPADPSHAMTLTVLLKIHNEANLDARIAAIYTRGSGVYRKFLTRADLQKFAPTQDEFNAVKAELIGHGFTLVSADPSRFSLRVRGTVANVQTAFQTALHVFKHGGKTVIAHVRDAELAGRAGVLVNAVSGLDQVAVHPLFVTAVNPLTKKPLLQKAVPPGGSGLTQEFTNIALGPVQGLQIQAAGSPQAWNLTGPSYGSDTLSIAFIPSQLQSYYGMNDLYQLGYTGQGQHIALLEGYGYDAEKKDLKTFAKAFHVQAPTDNTLVNYYPGGKPVPYNLADLTGWTPEIALDIQAVHTIAPDAVIDVIATNGQDSEDLLASAQYVIDNAIAQVISGSFQVDIDIISGSEERNAWNQVLKLGAGQGYSFQFGSGDAGDQGLDKPVGAVSLPAECPFATAVGGTSILNVPGSSAYVPTGWGNYEAVLGTAESPNPPGNGTVFAFGGGGGASMHFPKPDWQSALPGNRRLTPDVSALADPFTGVPVIFTDAGIQQVTVEGGTSLATPLFSAMWAIAGQYGGKNLGFAAPIIARLQPGEITDVVPNTALSKIALAGTYTDGNGVTTQLDAAQVMSAPDSEQKVITSAIWFVDGFAFFGVSFGQDTSLTVKKGWDNVTGFGEPNGVPFVAAVSK